MNKDKIIKDLKERNEKLSNQYRLRDIRCVTLENRIDKTINNIITTIQIIGEQPSRNVEEDNYILSKLESFIKTLGGDVYDE